MASHISPTRLRLRRDLLAIYHAKAQRTQRRKVVVSDLNALLQDSSCSTKNHLTTTLSSPFLHPLRLFFLGAFALESQGVNF